jgi:two-component system chemotaxis sensor kinase CheA
MDTIFSCIDAFSVMVEELRLQKPSSIDVNKYINNLKEVIVTGDHSKEVTSEKKRASERIDLLPQEVDTLNTKKEEGFSILKIEIELIKDCPMKEARAFLILNQIKGMGQIIKSIPSEDSIKKDEFDISFSVILSTKSEMISIEEKLSRVIEIETVFVEPFQDIVAAKTQFDLSGKQAPSSYLKKIQSMRITIERLDKIMNFMGELSIAKSRLTQVWRTDDKGGMEETVSIIDRLVSSLQDEILQTRLLPISYILDAFPRIVRDVVRKTNKQVDLEIVGSEIELDRVVLDEIGDPLVHIVRNAIDHGMEDVETRKAAGKPPKGKILIKVAREKGHVIVEVSDNGRGIDFKKVTKKAIEKGLITEHEALNLDSKQILDIMVLPGFSTSEEITDISGRGVGLDVVRAKLDSLGGRLEFETELGKGTKFSLVLPLTLAIIKAMLIIVGRETFAVPLMNIRESVKILPSDIKTIEGYEVIKVRDEIIPLIRLDKLLDISYSKQDQDRLSVVLVEGRVKSLGLLVDHIAGEQDIVVKPLGSMVRKIKGIAGATILGDGRVALILDVVNLR